MRLPTITRAIRAVLTSPLFVGAGWVLALAAWAGQRGSGDDADLGDVRRAQAVETFVEHRYAPEIVRMKVAIVATAIAFGVAIGVVAEILLSLRRPRVRVGRGSAAWAFARAWLLCAAVHAALVLYSMADAPQLYASRWYARGGALRTVQILATDVLGPRGVALVAVALAIAWLRPTRVASLVRAVRLARLRRLARPTASRVALAAVTVLGIGAASAAASSRLSNAQSTELRARVEARAPVVGALAPSATAAADDGRMNVLVLAADSLRADRLEPRVAPALSRLAARGTRFDRAYVSLPRTFPSWVTILTGRHPHHHGIRSMFPTWDDRAQDFDALPERLANAGWATDVVSDYAGDIFTRIDLGFGGVHTPSFDFRQLVRQRALERETPLLPLLQSRVGRAIFPVMRERADAADPRLLAGEVEARLAALARERRPFFLTVFFSTAHFPYAAPAPYYAKYTDPAYRGRFKYDKPVGLGGEAPADDADVRQVRALYDGAVTAIDDAAARVLATLDALGLSKRTIVVVTADHGETLFDHGHGQGHGDHLFGDEGTHVPLVIVDPRVAAPQGGGRRVGAIVRDVDLAPTLYALTGVGAPSDLDGASLAGALRGEEIGARYAFAETELWFTEDIPALPRELRLPYPGIMALTEIDARHGDEIVLRRDMTALTTMARHRMIRDDRWKLVYVPTRGGPKYLLFDVAADPDETADVAGAHPAEVARLKSELWAWMLKDPKMEARDGFVVPRDPRARARAEAKP